MQTRRDAHAQAIPSLLSLGATHTLLVVAAVVALVFLRHDAALSDMSALNPFGPPEIARRFFSTDPEASRVAGFFCFASAMPLAIYGATIVARLQFLGARHDGAYMAFAGGIAASGGLAAAGLFLWMLSVPEAATSIPITHALHLLVFLCGGPAFAVGLGLLAAGVSVSGHFARLLPTWVVWLGFLIATTGVLSMFGLLSLPMTVAIPITRVGGFGWLLAVGTTIRKQPAGIRTDVR
ncbi:MAG TPA: hypothetical protein VF785_07495 [Gemmatimonadaceae bacterium]